MTIAVAMALLISPILATPSSATSTLDQSTAVSGSAGLSAASDSTTFNYFTTAAQIYVVPSGVTQLTIQARGGDGAGASGSGFQSCGGAGALVTTVVDVNPGETLNIYVAGRGIHGTGDLSGSTGGWGYGSGGTGDGYGGGGGGGATAVILSGAPLVVAGGGGGAGRISGAFGGDAGVSSAGAGASGGNSGAGAGADGSGAGATGTRAGGSWGTGGAGGPGGNNRARDDIGPGAGGGGYGGGAGGLSGGTSGGGGGGGSMGAGTSTTIATAVYGSACVTGVNTGTTRLGVSGYVVITPGDIPNPVSVAETLHPDILQQVGIPESMTCAAFRDDSLNWSGVSGEGWSTSWAQWVNDGKGGAVCTRTLVYTANRQWSVVGAS